MNTADPIAVIRASEVMPGDCCRIDGCWETVYAVGQSIDRTVTLLTNGGDHTMGPTVPVEIAEAGA